MKKNLISTFSRHGLARAVSLHLIALTLIFLGLPGMLRAQTLLHRYSFVSDASDSVGTANGTLVAPTSGGAATISDGLNLPGNAGGGFGVSGYVSLPSGILTNTSSITVECWLTQNTGNGWAEAWDFAIDNNHNFGLIPDPDNNNHNTEVAFTPHGNEIDLQSETAFPSGAEQYVAVTFNSSSLTADLYTNGVLDASQVFPDATYTPGTIGGAGGTTENMLGNDVYGDAQFNGTIYEFRIWNGAVSQRYVSASALLGPSVIVTNLAPTSISVTAPTNVVITGTGQATATVQLPQTATSEIPATSDATWTSGNTNILTVNSSGAISGVGVGTTTVSASLGGHTATSGSITVTPQTLVNRYSFVSDASDSVSGADGTLVAPNGGAPATIDNGLMLPGNTVNGGGSGYSGYVSLPTGLLLGTSSLTVECWVTQNQGNTWAELWDFGNNGSQNFGLIPDSGSGNTRVAFTPNGDEIDISSSPLPSGSEQYVVVTYNNSTFIGDLYTNGVLDSTQTYPNIVPSYAPGTIGGAGGTTENMLGNDVYGDYQFGGTIYEFRIWNGAVSPLYVAASAAAGSSVVVTNLTPSSVTVTVTNTSMVGAQIQQATVMATLPQASNVPVTGAATNWASSDPSVLTVSSGGLITALSGGSATVSATVGGVTATSASITVALTAPVITQQPIPVTTAVGQSATLTVAALGGDLTYQWSDGITPIVGATNATLTLSNLALSQSGNYSVLVTNALGSTNSVVVALAVDTSILEHRYSFVSDASDSVGAANGTIVAPTTGGAATISGGLNLPGNASGGFGVSGYVSLPNGILTNTSSITVECWLTQNQGNGWAEPWDFGIDGSHNFALIPDPDNNGNNMEVAFTPHGNEIDLQSDTAFPTGTEQYVVVTFDSSSLIGNLYTNAVLDASHQYPDATYTPGTIGAPGGTTENMLGNDVYGDAQFDGTIYEFRIWDGVVSQLYMEVSSAAGSSALVTNLTPLSLTTTVASTTMTGESTQQATVMGDFADATGVTITGGVTDWSSGNTNILTVNSSGLITAVGGGSTTISATVGGVVGTSPTITVPLTAPTITQQPTSSATILTGGTLHTSVENIGLEPYIYSWYFNTSASPISGATSATLTIPNVQAANAGSYSVVISNAYGSVTSTPTVLTVVAPTAYQANLLALSPLAYWPLDETSGTIAYDEAGGYNGTYIGGVSLAQPGVTNAQFGSPSYSTLFDGASAYVDIPEGPFNITGAISIAAWVNLPATPPFGDIIGHGDASWRMSDNGGAGEPGAADGSAGDATSPKSIVDGNWHLVVYTYTGDLLQANNGSLYVDGALVANDTVSTTPAGDNLDVWIGGAPDYGVTYPNARLFSGYIAHAAVFTRALSAGEVGSLISGQANLSITLSGTSAVISWPSGVLLQAPTLSGPWTTNSAAVSPYTVPATSGNQFYKTVSP